VGKSREGRIDQRRRNHYNFTPGNKISVGHRKIKALLFRDNQIKLNRNTVQCIMRKNYLQCLVKPKRKWKSQGESVVFAPNLLEKDFTATAPNQKWVTDITYLQYGTSTLYLSTIMDLYNNQIL
jgi:putative transposase